MAKSKIRKFPELQNVEILDDDLELDCGESGIRVYRYMPFAYAEETVASNEIMLVSPEKWEYPFERRFFNGNYSKLGFAPKPLACGCFTTEHGINEAAAWKFYGAGSTGVQLTIDFEKLLDSLDRYAQKIGAKVYVKKAEYRYEKAELESAGTDSFLKGVNLESFGDRNFVRLAGLKRRVFAFENELRVVVYGEKVALDNGLLKIPMEKGTVRTLKCNPYFKVRSLSRASQERVKDYFKGYGVTFECSRLYSEESVSRFTPTLKK